MANLKSAKKRVKVTNTKTGYNKARKSAIKTYVNKFDAAIAEDKIDEAKVLLKDVTKKLDKAASKNIMHKNAVARKISRLTKKLNNAI